MNWKKKKDLETFRPYSTEGCYSATEFHIFGTTVLLKNVSLPATGIYNTVTLQKYLFIKECFW